MAYAVKTKVPVYQTKMEIEKMVKKAGAEGFGLMELKGRVQIAFQMNRRNIMFRVMVPENDPQGERSMWRALSLTIKGKLESWERGIETFEEAFLANIVMPDGRTVADHAAPAIESGYSSGKSVPLLPDFRQ